MANMSYTEWLNRKKNSTASASSPTISSNPSQSTTGGVKPSYSEWLSTRRQNEAQSSITGWINQGNSIIDSTNSYFTAWREQDDPEYISYQDQITSLLSQADTWRKQYSGNEEVIAAINDVVSALSGTKQTLGQQREYYSNWNTVDEYETALRQYGYQQKYRGNSYDQIQGILAQMEDGEEKEWLSQYAPSVMTPDDYRNLISGNDQQIQELEAAYDEIMRLADQINMEGERESTVEALNNLIAQYGTTSELKQKIEALKAENWQYQNAIDYNFLGSNADYDQQSKVATNEATTGFGIGIGKGWWGVGDPTYDYINDLEGTRQNSITATASNPWAPYTIYDHMKPEEIANYNYLYNTAGKDEADAYLEYLEYTLNQRKMGDTQEIFTKFANEAPAFASAVSIPINLMSGIGTLDVAGQNIVKGIKESVTGEYAGPVDYNRAAMSGTVMSSTIRGTVSQKINGAVAQGLAGTKAQNIVDSNGLIDLDNDAHPYLSKILNGRSLGDVYQLGMSMADSASIALMSPVFGSAGTVFLGGSAASQGILDAVANGATDGQAITMGILNGVFEMLFEKYSLESLLKSDTKNVIKAMLRQGLAEGSEEFFTSVANNIADILIMAENSGYMKNVAAYRAAGLSESEAIGKALIDMGVEIGWDFVGGILSGGIMGGGTTAIGNAADAMSFNAQENANNLNLYGGSISDLINEALEIDPNNRLAQKLQTKLDNGKNVSGRDITRIVKQNEKGILAQDIRTIQSAAESRLAELGETGDITAIAAALAKQAAGKKLTRAEQQTIAGSKYGQRVANELNTENIQSGEYSSAWAENIDTQRINVQEYSRLVEAAQQPQSAAENTGSQVATQSQKAAQAPQAAPVETPAATVRENRTVSKEESVPANDQQVTGKLTGKESLQVVQEPQANTVTLEDASKKYGAQAKAMVRTYTAGQDVAKYDKAYQAAYDMGRSGVSLSYVKKSESVSYLTDTQKELAYEAGSAAADAKAIAKDAANKAAANGKSGWKKGGVVRGEGVTIADLKKVFKDPLGKAYKALSTIAKATGVNIVLYKSKTDADGNFIDEQGEFNPAKPNEIRIDINAGLDNISDVGDLEKYVLLRTFSHEFTHFIEKWNPIQYNEFRKVVFDTLTQRGEDVNALIELQQVKNPGMDYESASREVVAEAMTDILPDANFVEILAQKHKVIFNKLLEKLKEFADNLRAYFDSIGGNDAREANALKEDVDGAIKYVDSIVHLFDKVAVQAVENFQQTVATEEVAVSKKETTTTVSETKVETKPKEIETKAPESTKDAYGFTISDNVERGSLEITFEGKPSQAVRDALKANKFRWNGKKGVWYGFADRQTITDALHAAYESETEVATENPAMQTLRDMGAKPVGENVLDVTDLFFPELKQNQREDALAPATSAIKANAEEAAQIYGDESLATVSLMDRQYVVQSKSDGTYTVSVIGKGSGFVSNDMYKDGFSSFAEASEYAIRWILANDLDFRAKWKKTYAELTEASIPEPEQSDFEKAFWNASQAERDEVVDAINENTKISHMAPTETRESVDAVNNEEVTKNGENVDNRATVQQPVTDGQGASRLLDEVETGTVPGTESAGEPVDGPGERGQQTVRDGDQSDAERVGRGSSEGSGQSGDLRGADRVTEESGTINTHAAAKEYAEGKGYRIELNKLAAKKNIIQVDIYDKQGLPTFNPIIIGELGKGNGPAGWNKVKEAIDKREAADKEKSAADTNVGNKTAEDTNVPSKETEKLHEEVVEQITQQSTEQPKGRNFVIGDSLELPSGEKARYKANVEAIRLVKQLEAEGRYATEAEQVILSKYVGWGGLANAFSDKKADWSKEYAELKELLTDEEYSSARGSTLNAHYTDISVIKAMYDGLKQLGFTGGRMMEPSSGVGNFVGAMPADMASQVRSWTMVELDGITGLIAKYLYPNADVRIQGFEKAKIPNDFMDVAISNVPFGNYPIADKTYPKKVTSAIHNYFFAKSLDKVRPGGIVMFITSAYTMNSKDSAVRRYIMQRADLLGAIRLPDSAFKGNAGTEVVTDILILKKRAPNTVYAGEDFLEAPYQYISGYQGAYINSYFTNHPEMVLGTASMDGGMYRGASLTYKALEGKGSLADQIREAFKNIQGKMDYPAQQSPEKTNFAVEREGKKAKNNSLVVKDGKVYQNKNGEMQEVTVAKGAAERIAGMLEIRDAAKELITYQQQGLKDTEIKKARQKLNKVYDAFVKKHGFINAPANRNAIKADPDSFSILALENWNPETKKAVKSDIFSKNTIAPNRTVTSAKNVAEGLIVSINQTGGVDAALIAKLTGKTEADVTRELIDSRKVFKNRDGLLEAAEVYLSGNVRAKLRDAEAMVPLDADYQKNVEALKTVMPEDVGYQDIFVNPGTPWIPDGVYSDFAAYMLGTSNSEWNQAVVVTRNKDTGNFTVELKNRYLKTNSYNTQKWGTSRRSFLDLFDAMLNSKSVVVKYKDADGKSVIDRDATAAANEKIENIQKEFQEWLWKDETRRTELAALYNETYNSIVTPKYNGDNLTVNGANAMKPLRPHQRNAVQRIISSGGNTLLAHKVGAGKTYEMAAAAMKLKQLGLVKKPLFAVPKSLVAQWGNEFKDFFPTAKLLVAEAGDFTAANRKIFANRIANGDYDAVIVSYEQFEKLPISADFARELYQEQIDSIILAIEEAKAEKGGKSLSVKDLEKKRKSLQAKIDKLTDSAKDEDNIEFEQLGVDSIFVDEAHNFKNLFYTTSMTNVSGLGNKDGSKRAFDLYTKVRYLQKLNGGRGIVFATATPVMNSMSEMYIMQKYLQPDLLDQLGLSTFDAWAKQFGEVVNGVEIKPSGQGYRVKQSFSRFKNMSELQLLFRNFADVLTDIPGLKIPKMKGGRVNVVVCEPGQFQQDYMKELEKRADNIKNVDPSVDNMLKITSDGRKISYTQRMIDPSLPYEEGCKIYRCADNVVRVYQDSKTVKGTQLIFCDMATPKGKSKVADTQTEEMETDMESARLYDDIKARLMKGGIPAREIAFIHEADTDAKKKKLFADVNDGKVRVLIGSTGKMGVGMNAQKRIVAIHHLDAPWRPGDVEQRNGRAYRQGNINDEVENFTYVTEGSFDARLWDILDRKQNFINQVMNGENVGRETEDTGEVTLSAAEVKALASGSPLIMEQVQLDTDIKKLESLRRAHRSAVTNAISRLETDKGKIAVLERMIANGKADTAARVDTYSEGKFSITVGNQKFSEKKDAGTALMAAATAKANEDGYTTIAKFAGFELRVVKTHEGIKGQILGKQSYPFNTYPANTTYMINHLIARVEEISEAVKAWEQELVQTRKDMAEQEQLITQPFAKQAELDQKRARYNEVMEILNPKEEQALDSVDEDEVQYQRRDYYKGWNSYELDSEFLREVAYVDRHAFLRSLANKTKGIKKGKTRRIIISGASTFYFFNATGYMNGSIEKKVVISSNNQDEVRRMREEYINGTDTSTETFDSMAQGYALQRGRNDWDNAAAGHTEATGQNDDVDVEASEGDAVGSYWDNYGYSSWEELIEAVKSGVMIMDENGDLITFEQHQQRTHTLTDREVLALAASELQAADLSSDERDALDIFQQRLAKLEALQEERKKQGRLYREQQFGAKVDRAAAEQTRNRMQVLDGQIEKAKAEVLSIEDKKVLNQVLQKARKVVEKQQWTKDQETLKRWRDRRNNADAIKKYRDRLRGDVDELTNWVLHPDNKNVVKHIPDALKNTVIPFLSSINFMSKRSLAGGNPTQADKALMEQTRKLAKVMEGTVDIDEMYSNYTDLPPDFMQNLRRFMDTAQDIVDSDSGDFIINQMTAEELKNLSRVVRTLKKYIMQINRFHVNAMFKHVYEAGDNSIDFLSQLSPAENTGAASQFLLWQQMRPAYAFERFGEGGMAIYDGLRRGQATLAFNTKKIQEFAEKAYTTAEVKAWENQVKTIRLGPGKTVTMRVSQIMALYELNKREQAKGHILGEGIRVATFKDGKKKISDVGQTLTPGELNLILRELTPRQIEVADQLQQFMQKQGGEWGNYVTVARFGEKQFGEENYFPINSDGRHLSVDADEKPGGAALYALLNMGFTKQTQEKAKNRIIVYSIFDVFANHMASMAQYNAFALPVVDALKWFNYQQVAVDEDGSKTILGSVREQMDRAFGVPEEMRPGSGRRGYAQNFVINIIKAFNGTEAQGTPNDTWGLQILHNYNRAQVAYNFRVVVQQPLAITRAALLLDYSSIIKGMKLSPAAIQKNIQEMQRYSGIAAWKSLGFYDVNISRGLTSLIKHDDTVLDKVADVGMWGAEKADTLTWAGIWSAAKEEVIRKQKLTPKSEGFYEAVTKLFEDVIYKTQVVDSVLTKNEFMRDKGFFARAVGSFMSEPTTTASMLVDAYDKYQMDMQRGLTRQQAWKKNSKKIVRTAYVYGLGALILAAVQAVADAFRDDDDYQDFMEKWLEAFGGNLVDEVMPFNKLPIVSDFYEVAKELLSILGVDTYGNPPQSVFMQWYDSMVKGFEILYDKISGADTNYTWYGGAYKMLQAVSGMTGLPMAAATREIVTAWNNIVGAMAPSLKVKTYEPSEKAQIKYAYQDGYLTAEEATEQLLQQGLVDSENEAYFTIQGWEAGDSYSRYNAIYDAVRNGTGFDEAMAELTSHGYSEKDVLSQVKSQIGQWYTGGEITKQQAIDMLTKYSDLDSAAITATVNKWSSKVVTGIAYEDIDDEYLAGNITAQRAIEMRMLYGGQSREDAQNTVGEWTFKAEYPELDGIITYTQYKRWQTDGQPNGVTLETFTDVAEFRDDGTSSSVKSQEEVAAYIDSLSISIAQKDALWCCFWKESTLKNAPWH